jgi:hypothetical protein
VSIVAGCASRDNVDDLRIAWDDGILTVQSERIPGGQIEVWYLEAFCRRGSTDRDWHETVIPHRTERVEVDPAGRRLHLRTLVDDRACVEHDLQSGPDEVDVRLVLTNLTDETLDIEWAQPCIRVGDFTGRGQDDYFERCFIFTDSGLKLMSDTHRETRARYTPGQVYVPEGIDLNDVNPRPISRTRPVNGLVGCFSADDRLILATAWDATHELFQGIIVCIHSDFHIGGLAPRETKHLHGKLYIVPNDPEALLQRYHRDFADE